MCSRALLFLVALVTALPFAAGCGSSTATTTVGPTPVRCQVQVSATNHTFTAGGGTGQLTVNAARECQWAAAAQADWIALAQASGQGEGALQYTVRPNPVPTPRRGSIVVEGQTVEVAQEAAPCTFELDRREVDLPAAGGTGAVAVRTHAVCGWTASSDAPWLTILEGREGAGPASVRYSAAANPGAARTARLTIAGQTVEVRQAAAGTPAPGPAPDPGAPPPAPPADPCAVTLSPRDATAPAGATTGTVRVTASRADCPWTATSSAPWLTITAGAAGTGTGQVQWAAEANTSAEERTASIAVGGVTFVLRQAGAGQPAPPGGDPPPPPPPQECGYEISPSGADVGAAGGPGTIAVSTGQGCAWTASSGVDWVTITAGGSGSGPGEVRYTVAANASSSARTGTLTVAGRTFTVQQAGEPPAAPVEVTLQGSVSDLRGSCPAISFVVENTRVTASDTTVYHRGNCRQVSNRESVRVTGTRQADGSVAASHIEIIRNELNEGEDGQ
jgi:hypothetical protein